MAKWDSFELNAKPEFTVLLAYQDFAAGLRAKEFFDRNNAQPLRALRLASNQ